VWIWELIQQNLAEHVKRRREELTLHQQNAKGSREKQWTLLSTTELSEAPVVIERSKLEQREKLHKEKVREHMLQQQIVPQVPTHNRIQGSYPTSASATNQRKLLFTEF